MADFTSLETSMHRTVVLAAGACAALAAVTVASFVYAHAAMSHAAEIGRRQPVLVVPGAVGGVYTPGITEENVRATARYLAALGTNFNGVQSFRDRFDELESFASAVYLPQLQLARTHLQHEVETQNQARSFYATPGTEELRETEPGHFSYSIRGDRVVYASGLPMDSRPSQVRLLLQWGNPSQRNRAGVVLEGFSVGEPPAAPAARRETASLGG